MAKDKHKVSNTGLLQIRNNFNRKNKTFSIRNLASNSVLICGKVRISTSDYNSKSSAFFGVFKAVQKSINQYVLENNFDIPQIQEKHPAFYLNKQVYYDLPKGFKFYYVDVKHCYWRIAYRMGLIDQKLYDKCKDSAELKLARNISLSILTSRQSKEYYSNGKMILKVYCENSVYENIYKNIRFSAYNLSGEIMEMLQDRCIGYQVDGIMIYKEDEEIVKKILRSRKMLYKTIPCEKVDDKFYLYDDVKKQL